MATLINAPIDEGQFDDAPRPSQLYIDTYDPAEDANAFDWPDSPLEDDDDDLDDTYDENRVEDEDWEIAERDFTKQYNRLKQHVAVRTGNAQGTSSALNQSSTVAALPAVNHPRTTIPLSAPSNRSNGKDKTIDQLASLAKYSSRIAKIDVPYVMGVGVNRKGPSAHANIKDKSDRATNEQVLDPRTRLILFKMIGRGLLHEVNGCVSTGKEANVYHAITSDSSHLALKIYKTSILVFKDRAKYVTGEYRFRRGYSRNPRKMVRLWAEKEMRNLKRLAAAGIKCPDPLEVRENVLVMTFVGSKEGWASPRLKDAELPAASCAALYRQLVLIVRRMFHECKLVHADLSEYNILFHEENLWIIDVSQSVEHDHPSAFDFLKSDIKNVEDFFGRLGVRCLGLRRCFEFVTRDKQGEDAGQEEAVLEKWLGEEGVGEIDQEEGDHAIPTSERAEEDAAHEDSVFLRSFIPRTLNDVYDPERDVAKLSRGEGSELIYADTIGVVGPEDDTKQGLVQKRTRVKFQDQAVELSESNTMANRSDADVESDEGSGDESVDDSGDSDNEVEGVKKEGFVDRTPRGHRHEDRDAKKERKKAVKAEAKEKRKSKMPKSEKKRIMKKTKS